MNNRIKIELVEAINKTKSKAEIFLMPTIYNKEFGWLYTATHDPIKFPSAILYGTWSGILGLNLLKITDNWLQSTKDELVSLLNSYRLADGTFLPKMLIHGKTNKSQEYLKLHCTNYSLGAIIELNPEFDFESPYLNRFLNPDFLKYWLEGRSLLRPWEEGNNIVNVCSYLALLNDNGHPTAKERLYQLLDWHNRVQNPITGGFDNFSSPGYRQHLESLAGAVHNFHLHLYLKEPLGSEELISNWMTKFLPQGRLSACLSLDFVELAVRTLPFSQDPQKVVNALLFHAEHLFKSQRFDGGWPENEFDTPTQAEGFKDDKVSSCSYATWFRLCSLGMIAIVLLGDDSNNWGFRKTLGMGYAPSYWPQLPKNVLIRDLSISEKFAYKINSFKRNFNSNLIKFGSKFL
ncbi:MAG: hypothetical protein CVU40_10095 [Chloroflexi bacterium HGW-Chloroflexi-2]|jgi:hypothetical protein|nr:MAG: hypothetical protein CVU40_10095 [Chloroflexi bacterium HGW-Chloroflexi-2]